MINRVYQVIIVAMAIVIAFMCIDSCNASKESEALYNRLGQKDKLIEVYKDATGKRVEYQPVQKFEDISQVDGLKKKVAELQIKNATLYAKYTMEFRVDTMLVALVDSIPCPPFSRNINIDSSFFKMNASIDNKEFKISSIVIPNQIDITVGERKYKWYQLSKKDTTSFLIQNSNTHITGKQIEPYVFEHPVKKWTVGASVGYGAVFNATGIHTGPTISLGITRRLFAF